MITFKSSPLKPLNQIKRNLAGMVPVWVPFKIVSVSAVLYPRWPPLLKIEISSNGQNCSILSQNVPKFELYKHNDELFCSPHHFSSVVCRPSFVGCCPFVKISHFNLLLRNHCANCNQTLVEWSLDGPLPKLCLVIRVGPFQNCV